MRRTLVLLAALVLVLGACSDDGDDGATTGGTATEATAPGSDGTDAAAGDDEGDGAAGDERPEIEVEVEVEVGDDDLSAWVAEVNAVCAEYEATAEDLQAEMEAAASADEVLAALGGLSEHLADEVEAIAAIPLPAERTDEAREVLELLAATQAELAALADVGELEDLDAQGEAFQQVAGELDAAANALGLITCTGEADAGG